MLPVKAVHTIFTHRQVCVISPYLVKLVRLLCCQAVAPVAAPKGQ